MDKDKKIEELASAYEPAKYEDDIYASWEKSGFFNPDNLNTTGKPFVISMPPPNATGTLHLGHASGLAYEDLMIRYQRLKGRKTLWLPGTDHAAIATQTKVEKILASEGTDRQTLGREKFLERVRDYVASSQGTIRNQTRKMGSSCDWSRERYTFDEGLSQAVSDAFIRMYNDGLIYRGNRIVNWCPRCQSTLADDEVEYSEQLAKLYYIKYGPFIVATTRPETKLADTGVAVNPDDDRYKKYVGQEMEIDLAGHKIKVKVFSDKEIDINFGSGAVGVTPAHSATDYEFAKKYDLKIIKLIDEKGILIESAGKYKGLKVLEAREAFVKDLEAAGQIEKIEDFKNNLSVCYRCETPIEPLTSEQWFVAVDKKIPGRGESLKELAIKVVKSGDIKILPERFEKVYFSWTENLHDWCISRQIWWGHRIPVWYCLNCNKEKFSGYYYNAEKNKEGEGSGFVRYEDESGNYEYDPTHIELQIKEESMKLPSGLVPIVSKTKPICSECGGINVVQDPDTLDTWFSSSLWTFSTLGWPEETSDFKNYHPTSVMETGYDIIFFWVARMIIMTEYLLDQKPFETVYLHGMVRDKEGRKLSKSLGNGIDPIDMINKFGTDALRLSLIIGSSPGADLRLYEDKIAGYRNFVNKLWNISRYIFMSVKEIKIIDKQPQPETLADRWILTELNNLIGQVTSDLDNFNFSSAGEKIYDFSWNKLADWYLEISKIETKKDNILLYILSRLMIISHPFTPYVTELIWKQFSTNTLLMVQKWPESAKFDDTVIADFAELRELVAAIRNLKAENKISPSNFPDCYIESKILGDDYLELAAKLARVNLVKEKLELEPIVINSSQVWINLKKEISAKEIEDIKNYIKSLEEKLADEKFLNNAPAKIIEDTKRKLEEARKKV